MKRTDLRKTKFCVCATTIALSALTLTLTVIEPAISQGEDAPPGSFLNSTPDPAPEAGSDSQGDKLPCTDRQSQSDAEAQPESQFQQPAPQSQKQAARKKFKPLQGGIEQSELHGDTENNSLQGGAEDFSGGTMNGITDQGQPLEGSVGDNSLSAGVSEDPDADNQELAIEWDRWRNTLLQAIQMGTLKNINVHNNVHFVFDPRTQMMQSRYPLGTSVWYSVSVLPNRKIVDIKLTQRSMFPSYDQAVIDAINSLQGSKILLYPRGSKRKIVSQEANVSTAAQNNFQNFNFGDVERQNY